MYSQYTPMLMATTFLNILFHFLHYYDSSTAAEIDQLNSYLSAAYTDVKFAFILKNNFTMGSFLNKWIDSKMMSLGFISSWENKTNSNKKRISENFDSPPNIRIANRSFSSGMSVNSCIKTSFENGIELNKASMLSSMARKPSSKYSFFQIASAATETMFCFIGYTMS